MRNFGWVVLGIAATAGCAVPDGRTARSEDNLEDAPASAAAKLKPIEGRLASCAIAAAATVRVTCSDDSAALPAKFLISIDATTARGEMRSFRVGDPAGIAEFFPEAAFPLSLRIRADKDLARPTAAQGLDAQTIEQTIQVNAPTELLSIRLPYDFWTVSVRATADTGVVTVPARPAAIAPWSVMGGGATSALFEKNGSTLRLLPAPMFLAVAPAEALVPAKIRFDGGEKDGVFEGPGSYVIGAAGMAREADAPPAPATPPASSFGDVPEELVSCHLGAASPDGRSIVCSTRAVPDVRVQALVQIIAGDGRETRATLPAAGDAVIGACTVEPCTVALFFQLDVGTDSVPMLVDTTLPLAGTSPEAPSRVRLPFDVWSVAVSANGQRVVSFEVGTNDAVLPAGWTTAGGSAPSFGRGRTSKLDAPLIFAAPVGATKISGKLLGIANGKRIDTVVTVERGIRYQVTETFGLVAAP